MTIHDFDDIRPYEPEEVPVVIDELLKDRQFSLVLKGLVPWLPKSVRNGMIRMLLWKVKSSQDFQIRLMKPLVNYIRFKTTTSSGCGFDKSLDRKGSYIFLSNHRDIVLDSAFLDVMLIKNDFERTCEIGIGDNLLIYPWIKKLVRLNKAFTVRRGLSPKEMLRSSILMSQYIHFAVNEKGENVWIAQREGRAKDSDDRTQEAVLKMFAMGGEGSVIERLKHLHIVPLAISYEYDPCDYLKAEEFQFKRDVAGWKKSKQDDLDNMKTGIFGKKGHLHYEAAPCIDAWLDTLPADMPKQEVFAAVAKHIDEEIHRRYKLYPGNWIALDEIEGTPKAHSDKYTEADVKVFEAYIAERLSKVRVPNPDMAFLRERLLTMYSNPARNYLNAISDKD